MGDASISENVRLGIKYHHSKFHAFNTKCTIKPKNVINLLDYNDYESKRPECKVESFNLPECNTDGI